MMKFGVINCECGQVFYFETTRDEIICVSCGQVHNTLEYPVKVEIVEEDQSTEETV